MNWSSPDGLAHTDDASRCESATVENVAGVLTCREHGRPVRGAGWVISPDAVAKTVLRIADPAGPRTTPVQADWRPGSEPPRGDDYCYVAAEGKIMLGAYSEGQWFYAGRSGPVDWWAPLIPMIDNVDHGARLDDRAGTGGRWPGAGTGARVAGLPCTCPAGELPGDCPRHGPLAAVTGPGHT